MDSDDADAAAYRKYAAPAFTATIVATIIFSCNKPRKETESRLDKTNAKPDTVLHQQHIPVKKKKKKTIYLTFDDGPNKGTRKVMHIADAEEIPITMFVIGEHVYGSKEQTATYDSIVQSKYVEIANHSFTHASHNKFEKFYAVPDSVISDFARCADSLKLPYKIIRTPGRNIWRTGTISATDIKSTAAAADSLRQQGYNAVGWDLEWKFGKQQELMCSGDDLLRMIDSVFAKGQTKTPDELVILAHDQAYADANDSAELHAFMKKLKLKEEYGFDVISNYPGVK